MIIVGSAFLTVLGSSSFIALALLLPSVLDALETAGQRSSSIPSLYSVIALFAIRLAPCWAIGARWCCRILLFRFYFSGRTVRALDGLDLPPRCGPTAVRSRCWGCACRFAR